MFCVVEFYEDNGWMMFGKGDMWVRVVYVGVMIWLV